MSSVSSSLNGSPFFDCRLTLLTAMVVAPYQQNMNIGQSQMLRTSRSRMGRTRAFAFVPGRSSIGRLVTRPFFMLYVGWQLAR
jgi:hypothetical protein